MSEPQKLVRPEGLSNAVGQVIAQNVAAGHNPNRFRQATANGMSNELTQVISALIANPTTGALMATLIPSHPGLLTIEDYVIRWGLEWGFEPGVISLAAERVQWFDQIHGGARYASDDD